MELTAKNVHEVFVACLFDKVPETTPPIYDGINLSVGFNPEQVEANRETIIGFLRQLPEGFQENGGSFLDLCERKDGQLWGQHQNMQELLLLGLAIDKMHYPLPRIAWPSLPGGMPIVRVKTLEEVQG